MTVNFNFLNADPTVQLYLDATERGQVTYWQKETGDWTFEFHQGHTTAYPLYVRSATDYSNENLPKMVTEGKTAQNYASLTSLANGGKLLNKQWKGHLEAKAQKDLLAVISNNWTRLQAIAKRYWTNAPVMTAPAPTTTVAATNAFKPCTSTGCGGQVPVVSSGKAPCDTCYRFQ